MNKQIDQNYLDNLRHTCAHLLAKAVLELWPGAHNAIGPAIENGFYQDFDIGKHAISEADLPKIEKKMNEILPKWTHFDYKEVTVQEARKLFGHNPYKLELLEEFAKGGKKLRTNNPGNFLDLCKMTHIENPAKAMQHFKLLSIAGAYWRGSEKNKMLTRIYGTVFPTKEELDKYLWLQEEAKKRDHRKLGKELGLFVFSDLVGPGLPMLTPKGATVRRILERFTVDEELKRGYQHVITPPLAKVDLYRTSGHYPYYKDTMYPPMRVDEDELILRPMTCPHHFMLYASQPRSYRDLPIRYAEISPQFRYEKSGELTGLMRVRMFMLADAHIITPKEQAAAEIGAVLDLIDYVNGVFGIKLGQDYRYRLSLGDRADSKKYYKDDRAWDHAEDVLRRVLRERNAPFFEAANEAAFYGPKIDVQVKNFAGHEETAFTVQYDFVMPKRFSLRFITASGQEEEPVVIHRSSLGAFERTMAFLIEKYAGAFPTWLAPVQVAVLPVSEKSLSYALKVSDTFKDQNIRVFLDDSSETIGKKILESEKQKIPYMLIVGPKEAASGSVSVRARGEKDLGSMKLEKFIDVVSKEISSRSLQSPLDPKGPGPAGPGPFRPTSLTTTRSNH